MNKNEGIFIPKKVATVYCNGGKEENISCDKGCNGCSECIKVCKDEAIYINKKEIAQVDEEKCTGCGKCVYVCEKGIIRVREKGACITPLCSNTSMGKDAISACLHSCIACRKCEKICPAQACKVINNRSRIADIMCLNCGACISVCPRDVIKDKRGIYTKEI